MTHAEEIVGAVAVLIKHRGQRTFTRRQVRDEAGVCPEKWNSSYNPTFQGMREDDPGGAPRPAARLQGLFRRVGYGVYELTDRGRAVVGALGLSATATRPSDEWLNETKARLQAKIDALEAQQARLAAQAIAATEQRLADLGTQTAEGPRSVPAPSRDVQPAPDSPPPQYRGSKKNLPAYTELVWAARCGTTTTYQAVAGAMGLPSRGALMAREVGRALGEISAGEVRDGRPMLSALVVNASGLPGRGFFSLALRLGKLDDDSPEGRRRFWDKETAAVYAAWHEPAQ